MSVGVCMCGCGEPTPLAPRTDASKGWVRDEPLRYLRYHYGRHHGPEYEIDPDTGCWLWLRWLDKNGYGRVSYQAGRSSLAHRVVYERHRGPIPEGLQIDHLCRVHRCVNPDHLEPVTNAENSRRGNMTRLTRAQVEEIRATAGDNKRVAARYGIHPVYVWQIRTGKKWVAA